MLCGPLLAQEQEIPGSRAEGYHLQVYEDLVEIPTLVMNRREQSFTGLLAKDFRMQLDSGPPFTPRHSRLEGDDPITMAVLLDDAGVDVSSELLGLEGRPDAMPTTLLHPDDQLILYGLDCNLVRATHLQPYTQAAALHAFRDVLSSPSLHVSRGGRTCNRPMDLWDSLAVIGKQISTLPGRRVVVVVTDGEDSGSRNTWEAVREYLASLSITVFAIRPAPVPLLPSVDCECQQPAGTLNREDRLSLLAGGTGGLVMNTPGTAIAGPLQRAVALVRNRYILEFHRASGERGGVHEIDVALPGREARIRPGGVTLPLRTPQDANDPALVHRDGSGDPVMGERRVLRPQP